MGHDNNLAASLLERIQLRSARVGVIGLGHAGLPLAVEFARAGFDTIGVDLDVSRVRAVNEARSYAPDVSSEDLALVRRERRLWATNDFAVVSELDAISICVPTPFRKTIDPDLSSVVSAVEETAAVLRAGTLVILESTTYPGTTEEIVRPMLEAGGLRAGLDFFLAFSAERADPDNTQFTTRSVPKIVGGCTSACSALAAALYRSAVEEVITVSSTRAAETVGMLEKTFRAVNIGLVNELALMCERLEVDVWEVVKAAATKPFGFMSFSPGPGVGGRCPREPFYLTWKAHPSGFGCRLIDVADQINDGMPRHVVALVTRALNAVAMPLNGARVLIAGVGSTSDVADLRDSPALDVMTLLQQEGADVHYIDPYIPQLDESTWPGAVQLTSVPHTQLLSGAFDCVVILTHHDAFDYELLQTAARVIVDTRDVIRDGSSYLFRLGAPNIVTTSRTAARPLPTSPH